MRSKIKEDEPLRFGLRYRYIVFLIIKLSNLKRLYAVIMPDMVWALQWQCWADS